MVLSFDEFKKQRQEGKSIGQIAADQANRAQKPYPTVEELIQPIKTAETSGATPQSAVPAASSPYTGEPTTPQSAAPTAPLTQGSLAGTGRSVEQVQQEISDSRKQLAQLQSDAAYVLTAEPGAELGRQMDEVRARIKALNEELDALNKPNTNAERDSLIQRMNDITAYEGYATTVEQADEVTREKQDTRQRLHELDEELGNAERFYDSGERTPAVVRGALKQTGAAYTNFMGTLQGVGNRGHEASSLADQAVAGSDYAGWATDELTAANMADAIMKENPDGNYLEGLQKEEQRLYEKADTMAASAAKDIEQAKEGLSALGKAGVDISVSLIQNGIDAAAKAAGLGMAPFFIRAAGGAMQEARQAGASTGQQVFYGISKAVIEVATELLSGGIAGTGVSGLDKVVEPLIDKLAKSTAGKIVLNAIYDAAMEGGEEALSDLLDPFAKLVYNDQAVREAWENPAEFGAQMLYDFLIGAAVGSIGTGTKILTGAATEQVVTGQALEPGAERLLQTVETEVGQPNAEAAPVQLAEESFSQGVAAVEDMLRSGRVSNTTANEILNNASLSAQFEDITGIRLDGTREENRRAIQRAAREYAYNAQSSESTAETAAVEAEAEEAVRTSGYGAYIRGVLKDGATVQIAREIINNPEMRATWEQMTGKTLPENQTSAVKMIMQTRRANPVIPEQQPRQRSYPTVEELTKPITQAEGTTAGDNPSVSLRSTAPLTRGSQSAQTDLPTAAVTQEAQAQTAETAQDAQESAARAETPPTTQNAAQTASGELNRQAETTAREQGAGVQREARTTEGADTVRGFSENVATDSAMETALREDIAKNPDLYKRLSNKDTLKKAQDIFSQGIDTARSELERAIGAAQSGQKLSPEMVPLSRMVANELTRRGELETARKIISDVAAELTSAGQLGQAGAILRNADPMTVLNTLQKAIDQINAEMARKFGNRNPWTAELTAEEIKQISETDFSQDGAFEAIQQQIAERLGREMPATLWEKLTELRRVGMLLRPRTQIKNYLSNIPMKGLRKGAEKLSGAIQDVLVKSGKMDASDQTRTAKVSKEAKTIAGEVYGQVKDSILGVSDKWDMNTLLRKNRTYFKKGPIQKAFEGKLNKEMQTSVLEAARRFTYDCLEKGDAPFVKSAFIDSLAQYCEARGITDANNVTTEAVEFATANAMEATFKNANVVAKCLNQIKRNGGPAAVALDILFPFTTTPLNITSLLLNYSPAGFANTATQVIKGANKADIIDSVAKASVGTAVMCLGYALRNLGMITGGEDEDKDKAAHDKAEGISPYSFRGRVSYDWAQPAGSLLALGAEISDAVSGKESLSDAVMNSIYTAGDSVLNMSIFQNVLRVLKGSGKPTQQVLDEIIEGGATQLMPGLAGDIAKIIDDTVRSTYTGGNVMDDTWARLVAVIPGLSKTLPESVNVKGEAIKRGGVAARAFNALINPSSVNLNEANAIDEVIDEVYEETGDKTIFRQVSPYKVDYGGETYKMTGEERAQFQKTQGQVHDDILQQIIDGTLWQEMDSDAKVKTMQLANQYALDAAKRELVESRGDEYTSDWDDEAELPDVGNYLAAKTTLKAAQDSADYTLLDALIDTVSEQQKANQEKLNKDFSMLDELIYGKEHGVDAETIYTAKTEADADGNGRISQEELWYYLGLQKNMPTETKDVLWDILTTGKTGYSEYEAKHG